jgi:ATP-dependent DNA ligase
VHELKFDGYRMHARIDGGQVKLLTRTGLDWSHRYRRTIDALSSLKRVDRPYAPGDRGIWIKSKCLNREEFVVVGWTEAASWERPTRNPLARIVPAGHQWSKLDSLDSPPQ